MVLVSAKRTWLAALADSDALGRERPPEECGCLYYSIGLQQFVVPRRDASLADQGIVPHFGAPGGVLPRMTDSGAWESAQRGALGRTNPRGSAER